VEVMGVAAVIVANRIVHQILVNFQMLQKSLIHAFSGENNMLLTSAATQSSNSISTNTTGEENQQPSGFVDNFLNNVLVADSESKPQLTPNLIQSAQKLIMKTNCSSPPAAASIVGNNNSGWVKKDPNNATTQTNSAVNSPSSPNVRGIPDRQKSSPSSSNNPQDDNGAAQNSDEYIVDKIFGAQFNELNGFGDNGENSANDLNASMMEPSNESRLNVNYGSWSKLFLLEQQLHPDVGNIWSKETPVDEDSWTKRDLPSNPRLDIWDQPAVGKEWTN